MRQHIEPQRAIESEFVCYYNGDEIGFVNNDAFRISMPRRAWDSAHRLRHAVGDDKLVELIGNLEFLRANADAPQMINLMEASLTWWADDPQDWAVFQDLVDRIIKNLQSDPGPRPQ